LQNRPSANIRTGALSDLYRETVWFSVGEKCMLFAEALSGVV